LQLIHVYPLDKVTNEGRLFWSLPKRAPSKIEFDPENEVHQSFIAAYACLTAKKFGIKDIPKNPRSKESKSEFAKKAAVLKVKDFVPNDQKA
jgi:ubiquitin-activating enzyme E1